MTFGDAFRTYRRCAGLTQEQAGQRVGASQQQIERWERPGANLCMMTVQRIAVGLGICIVMRFDVAAGALTFEFVG